MVRFILGGLEVVVRCCDVGVFCCCSICWIDCNWVCRAVVTSEKVLVDESVRSMGEGCRVFKDVRNSDVVGSVFSR